MKIIKYIKVKASYSKDKNDLSSCLMSKEESCEHLISGVAGGLFCRLQRVFDYKKEDEHLRNNCNDKLKRTYLCIKTFG